MAAVVLALALGAWARSSALDAGFWADDYLQHAMLEGAYPNRRAPWDLFRFADGSPDDTRRLVDYGVDPWWTHPGFRLSLLRPLPSLLHAFDYASFGSDARAHHLHSLVWWGLMVAAVAAFLFALLPRVAAAIALLMFAIDESQTVPVVWLCNRSALVSTALAVGFLVCHLHWRRTGRGAWRAASIALLALALAGGEYGLASLGYAICMELGERFPGVSRTRALAPLALLSGLFVALSAGFGYGSAHSTLYTNPLHSPLAYAAKAATGVPVLVGELTLGVPADWWSFGSPWPGELLAWTKLEPATWQKLPSWRFVQVCLGLLGAGLALGMLRFVRGKLAQQDYRTLLWLLAGSVLGLLPVLGSFVTTRLTLPSDIGFAALFGCVVACGFGARASAPGSSQAGRGVGFGAAMLALAVLYVHGYRALHESVRATGFYTYVALSRTAWPLSLALDDGTSAGQRLIMIAAADANDAPHLPFVRFGTGHPLPRGFRLLSGSPGGHELTRLDANTLELRVLDAFGLEHSVVGSLTRSDDDLLPTGQRAGAAGMHVQVLELREHQPIRMRFRFDVPLEDPSLVFFQSTPQGLQKLALPAIGERVRLPPPSMPDLNALLTAARVAAPPASP